jgi:ABC-type multidrug transport system permease subunit
MNEASTASDLSSLIPVSAKFLAELPFNVGAPVLFGCIVYWAVGLNPAASRFGLFLLIIVIQALSATGLGLLISGTTQEALLLDSV